MEDALLNQVRHLREVEGLSIRQISDLLGMSRKKVTRLTESGGIVKKKRSSIMDPYGHLIDDWYGTYPSLKATQVFDRLQTYGYTGRYTTVKEYTRRFRRKRKRMYHELSFLPGEEAQVDWMQRRFSFGVVYGFVFILSYSRYLYARFYPRQSMEFFLEGHMEAYKEISGIPHQGRYDNLKSVVIKRKPEIVLNTQFLDFARHYGFSVYPCTPGRANEKGRVERVIQDIGHFLTADAFTDMNDLNRKLTLWRTERNGKVHRTTGKAPREMLQEEKLKTLPQLSYKACRMQTGMVSPTGFIRLETNRYSVPSAYSHQPATLVIHPRLIEIVIRHRVVATHQRSFLKDQKIENPLHRERVLQVTPHFKYKRIYQLMAHMDNALDHFLKRAQDEGEDPLATAYELFRLLRSTSKHTLLSVVREANKLGTFRVAYITSRLQPPGTKDHPVYPQDNNLLNITYERSDLAKYDDLI
ncbi:MAG: IS21 family transposase [Syntrophales bacterium]